MLPSVVASELEQVAADAIRTAFHPTAPGFSGLNHPSPRVRSSILTWDGVMQKLHHPGGPPALQRAGCGSSPFTSNCLRRKWCTVLSSRQRIETFWPLASSCTST